MDHRSEQIGVGAGRDTFKEVAGDDLNAPCHCAGLQQRRGAGHDIWEVKQNALDFRVRDENVGEKSAISPADVRDAPKR
jgi:hypothetical protein